MSTSLKRRSKIWRGLYISSKVTLGDAQLRCIVSVPFCYTYLLGCSALSYLFVFAQLLTAVCIGWLSSVVLQLLSFHFVSQYLCFVLRVVGNGRCCYACLVFAFCYYLTGLVIVDMFYRECTFSAVSYCHPYLQSPFACACYFFLLLNVCSSFNFCLDENLLNTDLDYCSGNFLCNISCVPNFV